MFCLNDHFEALNIIKKRIFVLQVKNKEMERRPFIATGSRGTRVYNYTYIYEFRRGWEVINEKLPTVVFLRHSRIDLNMCSVTSLICKVYKLCKV